MRTVPHRVPLSRRRLRAAAAPKPSASRGPVAPTSPRPSTGATRDSGPRPGTFAAPVLIQHTPNPAAEFGDAGTPGVLLLDGPPGTPFVWHRVLPALRSRGVQAGTVKRPGHPAAAGPAGDPVAAAAGIARLLDDEQQAPAVIVGHSVGVGVALALAVNAPRHVRALVLVGPAAGLLSIRVVDRLLAAPMLGPVVTYLGFRVVGLALYLPALRRAALVDGAGLSALDAKALVREIAFGTMWRKFARQVRRLVREARQGNQQVAGIDCPVLIVVGDRDRTARRPGRAVRRLLPAAEVVPTAAAGHLIPIDDPDCVADAVLRALRREYRASLSARRFV